MPHNAGVNPAVKPLELRDHSSLRAAYPERADDHERDTPSGGNEPCPPRHEHEAHDDCYKCAAPTQFESAKSIYSQP